MQFNSWIFLLVFLPVSILLYFLTNKYVNGKVASCFLVISNLIFYGYAGWGCVLYFLVCSVLNYAVSRRLIYKREKRLMIFGVALNIGALGVLKYCNFFINSLNIVLKTDFNFLNLFLPLGLSFFSFQFIALVYDCYKGNIRSLPFVEYMVFASFFPKIIQGPIMTYQDFEKQYFTAESRYFNAESFSKGVYAFSIGLGKKILLADALALFVNAGFSGNYSTYNSTMSILLMLVYTLQIYFDFSAYTDMARGLGFMFNIELPKNFNSPYKALSVNEFWKRWHMSLTVFFTKYLYIPLGGNRKGEFRTYLNVLIVFMLSGLWHGANYTFIIWGLLHGIASIAERKWDFLSKAHAVVQWGYTFLFTNIAWLFFRSNTLTQALHIIRNILRCDFSGIVEGDLTRLILPEINALLNLTGKESMFRIYSILFICASLYGVVAFKNTDEQIKQFKPTLFKVFITVVIVSWCILSFGKKITFIYEMF